MDSVDVERRLAAILSADAVGYSRLMAEDEVATVQRLTTYRGEMGTLIRQHDGRVVDAPGDNLLAEFPSALEAAHCAVELQRHLADRNSDVSPERRLVFRIGVHLGDVVVEGDHIYGDGVNIAARLESLAEPGGICISGEIEGQVESKLDLVYEDLGEQRLKNMERAVRVYRVRPKGEQAVASRPGRGWTRPRIAAASVASLAVIIAAGLWQGWPVPLGPMLDWAGLSELPANPLLPDKPSIAVLPFVNMSSDPEQEYFSDGLSEEILGLLARVSGLKVTARTSSFAFKGKNEDIRTIGETLDVNTVVEGSVRKSGERVRITAQLIDVASGTHIWSETYDRTLTDIFAVQDSVASEIIDALQIHVGAAPTRRRPTENPEAYLLALKARAALNDYDGQSAERFLHRSIELDPEFAEAHELLALSYGLQSPGAMDPAEAKKLTHDAAAKALAMDPGLLLARALWESGRVEGYSFHKEIQAFERVVREDPIPRPPLLS